MLPHTLLLHTHLIGESEIRTHGTISSFDFKSNAIDHSAISPNLFFPSSPSHYAYLMLCSLFFPLPMYLSYLCSCLDPTYKQFLFPFLSRIRSIFISITTVKRNLIRNTTSNIKSTLVNYKEKIFTLQPQGSTREKEM